MQANDTDSAEKYLTSFAKLVRYTLENSETQEVSLNEELQALKNYVELEMQRFKHGFEFQINCDDDIELDESMLPSLILQPFVENAIKHGIERLNGKGKIIVGIKKSDDSIIISVEDNGVGRMQSENWNEVNREKHYSLGSSLTFDRIDAYNKAFNRKIRARIIDLSDTSERTGTRVEVFLDLP